LPRRAKRRRERSAAENDQGDAFDVLADLHAKREEFDVVVLDPPAFIKRRKDIPKGEPRTAS